MKITNYVYRATIRGKVGDEMQELPQLFAATGLRRALGKAERWIKEQEIEGAELVSLVKEAGVVL